jgi:S-disulfanyl-L-cysteine oxidoreductase SoxD
MKKQFLQEPRLHRLFDNFMRSTAMAAIAFAVIFALSGTGQSANTQDLDAGKKVFRKCMACHAVGEDARHKIGPHLNELMGRKAGSIEDYPYSPAMINAGKEGLVWNETTINEYVIKPKAMIEDTKMAFAGLKKQVERQNLLAYLKSFSSDSGAAKAKTATAPAQESSLANRSSEAMAE